MNRSLSLTVVLALLLWAVSARGQSQARQAGYLYLSPVPGASYVSPETRYVLVRFESVSPEEVTNLTTSFITVTGAITGPHPGVTSLASDGRTIIHYLSTSFASNEMVTVTLNPLRLPDSEGVLDPFEYKFMVGGPMPGSVPAMAAQAAIRRDGFSVEDENVRAQKSEGSISAETESIGRAVILPNGISVPSDFPEAVVSVNNNPSPGYIFVDNPGRGDVSYSMMLDNSGLPVWYHASAAWQFKVQENGIINWDGINKGYDQNFNFVRNYHTVNGYRVDYHELEVLADGTYIMVGQRDDIVDMTLYVPGADPSALVYASVIQEFTPSGELIFQWRGWDHYDIRDMTLVNPLGTGFTFPHFNAIDVDTDGNILVSARSMSEVTKINRDTGEVIWRLSGAHSSFTFVNDPFNGFSCQHDISALGNNRYMVFDNGDLHDPKVSRAVEYELDLTNMTATLVWQYRDTPDKYTQLMGNAQRLPTGNTLINFVLAQYPTVIEVDSNGVKRFEMNLLPDANHYRVFRFPWNGVVAAPYLIAEPGGDNVTLIFNKFGDDAVDYYRIYGGTTPAPTNLVATSRVTLLHLTNVVNGVVNYFRVTAVSTNGVESNFSNEASLLVNVFLPGQNMVLDGAFDQSTNGWVWQVTPPALAQLDVTGGICHFQITSGGAYLSDVQLYQAGIPLTYGKRYNFSFDAWSAVPRIFEAKVEQSVDNGINYSGIQPLTITPVTNHFAFQFTMNDPSDQNARVTFNAGALPLDVYIDNVTLTQEVYAAGDLDYDGHVGFADLKILTEQWQKTGGTLTADLNGDGKVDFSDFVLFSESWSGQ